MPHFAVTRGPGPRWDGGRGIREQRGWDEHARFMDGLVAAGFIGLGGPLDDGHDVLHLVHAPDEEQVRSRFDDDPWSRAGLLVTRSVRPWALWLDGRG